MKNKTLNTSDINCKNIKGCFECPFRYSDYDDFAVGDDTLEVCTLAREMKLKNYFIYMYDTKQNQHAKLKTPKWCPIRTKPLLLKYIGK